MDNPSVDCLYNGYVYFLWYSLSLSFIRITSFLDTKYIKSNKGG